MTQTCDSCGRDVYVDDKTYWKNPAKLHFCVRCSSPGVTHINEQKDRKQVSSLVLRRVPIDD